MTEIPEAVRKWVIPAIGLGAGYVIATRTPIVDVVNEKLAGPIGGIAPYATATIYAIIGFFLWSMGGLVGKVLGAVFFGLALKAVVVDALGVV